MRARALFGGRADDFRAQRNPGGGAAAYCQFRSAVCRFAGGSAGMGHHIRIRSCGPPPDIAARFRVSVVRREDLLSLDFLFFNLAMEAGGGNPPQLVRKDLTQPSY